VCSSIFLGDFFHPYLPSRSCGFTRLTDGQPPLCSLSLLLFLKTNKLSTRSSSSKATVLEQESQNENKAPSGETRNYWPAK